APGEATELRPDPAAWSLDWGPPGTFSDAEQAVILARCYELFLIWADAVAQPLTGEDRVVQADRALRILDRAVQLRAPTRAPTRAYHLRRANYLAQKGDEPAAQQERARGLVLQPDDVVDFFLLGQQASQGKKPTEAVTCLRDALKRQPEHFWARVLLAVTYL